MATPGGLFALAVMAGAYAYSKHRTALQQRVERGDTQTGPTNMSDDLPDVDEPEGPELEPGTVAIQGNVDTKNWGQVLYRIQVHTDGQSYVANVKVPGANQYAPIQLEAGGPRLFASPEDAEAFARSWILSADEKPPSPKPVPPPPQPKPGPDPAPKPAPDPSGPSGIDTCVHNFYLRTPQPLAPSLLEIMGPAAQASVSGATFYLTPQAQVEIFQAAKSQFLGSQRSVRGLVTRDILNKLRPECDWNRDPVDAYSEVEFLTWQSAWTLSQAAAAQVGFRPGGDDPDHKLLWEQGTDGVLIGRQWLELPEVGKLALPLGRRVELLAGELTESELPRPIFLYPERLFARVVGADNLTGAPIVKILAQFNNQDVSPLYSLHHGYKVGDDVQLRASAPTGVRRIFAEGVT